MALLKVSEFAATYGFVRNNVYTYEKRGKLIITDGYIDEANPINRLFIDSRNHSPKVEASEIKRTASSTKHKPENKAIAEKQTRTRTIISNSKDENKYVELIRSRQLQDQKIIEEVRIAKIRADKMEGKLIPVEIVNNGGKEIFNRYKQIFLQQTEQLIRDTFNELLIENKTIKATCSKLVDISNECSNRVFKEFRSLIDGIVEQSTSER